MKKTVIDTTKETQFSDAWLFLALLLTFVGLWLNSAFLTAAAGLILILTLCCWLWDRYSYHGLSYQRSFSEDRAFQGETITLQMEVRNRKLLPLPWLNISDQFPTTLPLSDKTLTADSTTNIAWMRTFWSLAPFQKIRRTVEVDCVERGFFQYGPAKLHTGDGFGFFSSKATLPKQDRLIVYPRLYSVVDLNIPTRNPFGNSRATGQLFEDPLRTVGIREWQQRDSLRRIHWKATARHQELLSRIYEPSEEQQILIFLNVATLERHWHGHIPELQERTISVAGSLAALAIEERLSVGLIANGTLPGSDQALRLMPGRAPGQLTRILELLAAVTPFAAQPIEQLLMQEAPRVPWGSTLVLVTAIAHESLLATLMDLAAAGRTVVLFTLAKEPPIQLLPNIRIYHLPHLAEDLIAPTLVA